MAAETSTSSSSSSSHDYEVFLSFTGHDTRTHFTDHLYHALQRASIRTFRDREELRYGEKIEELLRAIEQSRISIPVFSENYASSTWCLKEIAKIMERKETHGQIVLPIFYKVDPSHVRNQTGSFKKAFLEHEKKQPKETVDSWRKALREAGNLKGWDTQDPEYSYEANLINLVVGKTLSELNKTTTLDVAKHPVGIDAHVQEVLKLLDLQSEDVIFVGINGIGGIGKTTIAKAVCNRIFHQFHGWCFLAEVRERASKWEGLVELQNKLVYDIFKGIEVGISTDAAGINVIKQRCRNKKVLIILDDVDQDKQLDALAGGHDWFGSGSRILITTRDEHILNVDHDKNKIYKPKALDNDLSRRLFSNHAFGRDQPPQVFRELSKEVAKVASGLPLALVLLGSLLRDKTELTDWRSALQRLNKIPDDGVQKISKVCYDGLEDDDKEIFLDIACFFIGMDEETVIRILEDYCTTVRIKVLVLKSLVKIDYENKLTMHDLLQDMGREIVRKESFKNPGGRSRLWLHEEALDVLKKGKGTSKVEGLCLDFGYESKDHCLRTEAFEAMSGLRLLQIDHAYLDGNFDRFPIGLKWLRWRGLPSECIPTISHLEKLVVLDMSESMITEDWNGWQHIQLIKTLKVLDLSLCNCLTRTANFSNNGSLERLILDNCTRLVALHESIGHLKKLVFLSLRGCISLMELPDSICELNYVKSLIVAGTGIEELPDDCGSLRRLERLSADNCHKLVRLPLSMGKLSSIKSLTLRECKNLEKLPEALGTMKSLAELYIDGTAIEELPDAIGSLEKLETLSARYCKKLIKLPHSMGKMRLLRYFDVEGSGVVELPRDFGMLLSLVMFNMLGCKEFKGFPENFGNLARLSYLDASICNLSEDAFPTDFGRLSSLKSLHLRFNKFCSLPASIICLSRLQTLDLECCTELQSLPDLPFSLIKLNVKGCISMDRLPNLSTLKNLEDLCLNDCKKLSEIEGITHLPLLQQLVLQNCRTLQSLPKLPSSLIKLNAKGCVSMERLPNLSNLKSLQDLCLNECEKLPKIEGITGLSLLRQLHLENCRALQSLPDLPSGLIKLDARGCVSMESLPNLSTLTSLQDLCLNECEKLPKIEGITGLSLLRQLHLENCRALQSLPDLPSSLIKLDARGCVSMERLPNLSNLKSLQDLCLNECEKLPKIEGITDLSPLRQLHLENCRALQSLPDLPSGLIKLDARGCVSMERLPNLSNLKSLQDLYLNECEKLPKIEGITGLSLLQQLHLENCRALQSLPDLPLGLIKLDARGCVSMERLPNLSNLTSLQDLGLNECEKLPKIEGITGLSLLRQLHLENCRALQSLPDLPSGLIKLDARGCVSMESLPNLSTLKNLKDLCLNECEKLAKIEGITDLLLLQQLHLENCKALQSIPELPPSLIELNTTSCSSARFLNLIKSKNLQVLGLCNCNKLSEIPGINSISLLRELRFHNCPRLQSLPEPLTDLKDLCFEKLAKIEGISGLTVSEELDFTEYRNLESLSELLPSLPRLTVWNRITMEKLPDLSNFKKLVHLELLQCKNLSEIPSISGLSQLQILHLGDCGKIHSLTKLPSSLIILYVQRCGSMERLELSNLENLEKLNLECCDNLTEIRGFESLESLKDLRMSGCHTCTKNFQKSVAQGMLPCSFDRRVIEPGFRQSFDIADDDNINGTVLYFVIEYEILVPESPSPIDRNVISIAAVIRRNNAKMIECFHELKVEGMMAKTNVDQFYSCCFHGLTWFGFPLKDGDQIEVTGLCFLTEEDIRTNDESNFTNMLDEASFQGVDLKMFDFVMEHEAPEDSQQLENRVVHLINPMWVDVQGSISGLEQRERVGRREHDGAGRSPCWECCNIC